MLYLKEDQIQSCLYQCHYNILMRGRVLLCVITERTNISRAAAQTNILFLIVCIFLQF